MPSRINSIARSGMSEWASNQMISVILSRGILSVRFWMRNSWMRKELGA